jgi:hypothetical protein
LIKIHYTLVHIDGKNIIKKLRCLTAIKVSCRERYLVGPTSRWERHAWYDAFCLLWALAAWLKSPLPTPPIIDDLPRISVANLLGGN